MNTALVMAGVDFIDTVVVRSICKGTNTVKEPLKSSKWAGAEFKKEQEAKLAKKRVSKL